MEQEIPSGDLEVLFPTKFQPNNLESEQDYRINDDVNPILSEKICFGHLTHEPMESPNVVLEVDELEKDALLGEASFPEPYCTIDSKEKSDLDFRAWEVEKKLNFEGTFVSPNFDDEQKSTEYVSKKRVASSECNEEELRVNKDFYNCSSKRSCPKDSEVGTPF